MKKKRPYKYRKFTKEQRERWNKKYRDKMGEVEWKAQRAAIKKRYRAKQKIDINGRIEKNLRDRFHHYINKLRGNKFKNTFELLGCSAREYVKYIESLWLEGMSWDNYGLGKNKWQIDHIVPVNHFDLLQEDQQVECFHYSNTAPMWAVDNMKKSDSINFYDPKYSFYTLDLLLPENADKIEFVEAHPITHITSEGHLITEYVH